MYRLFGCLFLSGLRQALAEEKPGMKPGEISKATEMWLFFIE